MSSYEDDSYQSKYMESSDFQHDSAIVDTDKLGNISYDKILDADGVYHDLYFSMNLGNWYVDHFYRPIKMCKGKTNKNFISIADRVHYARNVSKILR